MSETSEPLNWMTRAEWTSLQSKELHRERVEIVRSDANHFQLADNTRIVIHIIPQVAFIEKTVSAKELKDASDSFIPLGGHSTSYRDGRYNVEGYLLFQGETAVRNYSQLYRNGMYEGVMTEAVYDSGNGNKLLREHWCEEAILNALTGYLPFAKKLGFNPPFLYLASLLGCQDAKIIVNDHWGDESSSAIDREVVHFPETRIDSFDIDPVQHLRSTIDVLWNCAGRERSPNYDSQGNRKPKR